MKKFIIALLFPLLLACQAGATTSLTAPTGGYVEGSWTPTVGGTATYLAQIGSYIKIGRLVRLSGILAINLIGTGVTTGIQGLPFTAGSTLGQDTHCAVYFTQITLAKASMLGVIRAGENVLRLFSVAPGGDTIMQQNAVIGNSTTIEFTCVYYTS